MKKVLLIDDEMDCGIILTEFFAKKNIEVYISYTLQDGLRVLEEILPDFIFLDNKLPDGSGWAKTDFILSKCPKAELTLISAYNAPKTSATTFRILEKPIFIEDLDKLFSRRSFGKTS